MRKASSDLARKLRKEQTRAEAILWQRLRDRQVTGQKWRRQAPIDNYVVDFLCSELRIIVELDGDAHADRQESDVMRQAYLENQGFRVIRFLNEEVLRNLDGVLETLCRLSE